MRAISFCIFCFCHTICSHGSMGFIHNSGQLDRQKSKYKPKQYGVKMAYFIDKAKSKWESSLLVTWKFTRFDDFFRTWKARKRLHISPTKTLLEKPKSLIVAPIL